MSQISESYGVLSGAKKCVHQLFEERAAEFPNRRAIGLADQNLTYRELNSRANQLANHLRQRGVGPEVIVAIFLDRSPELIVAILAILKAGGAYLPIDLTYPKDRVAFMLQDAQVSLVLTQHELASKLPVLDQNVVYIDDLQTANPGAEASINLTNSASPDNLAYVIFTSGSTGQPKGTLVTHHNVVRLFQFTNQWYHFNQEDVWTLFHSCAFDFSVWEIWGALIYGGRLVIVPYMTSRSPEAFYELLSEQKVTILNQTPSAFRQLVQTEESAKSPKPLMLRYIIFGGEALEMRALKPWFERHGDQSPQLVNMYGITETTVHVTYRPLTKNDLQSGSVIGIPIPDLKVYILNAQLQPVPNGEPAELFVGGAGLARGYLNRPALTAERFIPDPFSREPGARLYRTGDLARFLPNGDIEYLGRIDQQVKIRGFRIELGEIESVLAGHPGIREAVVLVPEEAAGEKRLVAYLIATSAETPKVSDLRNLLRAKLPEYMVPSAFVFIDSLPLTSNGKLDRKALPSPDEARANSHPALATPANALERDIAGIWQKVLQKSPIGLEQNFFDVGGDSIRLASVHADLQKLLGIQVPITDLFAHTTVRSLAAHFDSSGRRENPAASLQARARRQREAFSAHRKSGPDK